MKKNLIMLWLAFACPIGAALFAQDTLKSFNNRWATELNFNPFDGNLSFNNAAGQIKFRYLQPNFTAWRLALTVGYNQNNSNVENVYGYTPYDRTDRQKSLRIGLNAGREKHFNSSRRLSPYIGWEVGVGIKSSSQKTYNNDDYMKVKGAWITYEQVQYNNSSQYYTQMKFAERGFWSVGGNVVMGFDFYMAKNFYFGYEMQLGLDYKSYADVDVTQKYSGNSTTTPEAFPDYDEESWDFGPKLVNGIRIGFVF
jgi:hypothetical protein